MKIYKALTIAIITFMSANAFSDSRPIIKDILASSGKGTKINISWTVPENPSPKITRLFIYRTTRPVASYFDIINEKPIATVEADYCGWTDSIKDYRDYYYSVLAEVNGKPYDIILPSINSTVRPAHLKITVKQDDSERKQIPEKLYPDDAIRETPLPYLDLINDLNKNKISMDDKTIQYARELGLTEQKTKKPLSPYVFEEDLISPDGGDDYLLFEILSTSFIQKKYKECTTSLIKMLGTNRSEEVTKRAQFYLGQSYYFSKNYKNAVESFLKTYDNYPKLSKKWIDSSLTLMEIPE